MKKYLILIAGSPATGKSHVVKMIQDEYSNTLLLVPDEIKEMYADSSGFSNLEEKHQLEKKIWNFYYSVLNKYMKAGKQIVISEYPFSIKQYDTLKKYSEDYDYNVITIRLVAEFETLWKRRYKRDREFSRHPSHLMKSYHYGDQLLDTYKANNHITKLEFKNIIQDRKYNEFALGKVLEVDMTDFNTVDYDSIIGFLTENIRL